MIPDVPPPPPNAGMLSEHVPLAGRTTWRIGGLARWLATFQNVDELASFWSRLSPETPRFILGGGSNILISDSGFHGVVLDMTHGLNQIHLQQPISDNPNGEAVLFAQAGASTRALAHKARQLGLGGAEFLAGIPGSVGGALVMNAGAHGGELKDILIDALVLDPSGERHILTPTDLKMSYRHSALPTGWIFVSARFRLVPKDRERIRQTMQRHNHHRRLSQPLHLPSAGSTFKNPPHGPAAWKLIEDARMRGAAIGQARVSDKHCNFLVNMGQASATDMTALIRKVQNAVLAHSGIKLHTEVGLLGPTGLEPF
ncbi:MAG: UDP-N-acetylmuramate dehydrogenase [Magnetococcales bacterium]|nr:UDP-N-acetylmuramate dehydrogenase [Magnetococcales bacterium]MBF0150867.1 UDP-N-acetylmuramate dehydrogenase [Magnetococcales bacterium]MBF0173862.1 UDP-N-acetylmuramate dehydrogenase [Magnetococcales bacterium]MBF0347000.1 UDP-N-acetylmuramate dehydrogenase [Magnetococcales bacterium]MBF0631320.1 UDP-N-acetylmuramate dehydrogenase [Magnetococcales bacterium]